MDKVKSYLSYLKFDPKLQNTTISKYLTNFRYVLLLIIAIAAAGIFSFLNLPRRLNPEVKIPIVSVSTVLPGAGPEDVESLVTIPIEDQVVSIEGVDKVSSTSQDSLSLVVIEFQSKTDPENARDDVQSAVDSIADLPQDTNHPNIQKLDFENQPVWTFLITSKKDDASLMRFAENLKDTIEKIPTVKSAQITGIEEQEVEVIVKPDAARQFNINAQALSQLINSATNALPIGNVNTQDSTFTITIDPTVNSPEDLRKLKIDVSGQIVELGNITEVTIRAKPNVAKTFYATKTQNAKRGVVFSIFKSDSADISKTVGDVKEVTDLETKNYEGTFEIISLMDFSKLIDDQFNELAASFRDTIILVFIVLFIFLGVRQALIVALTIPLSFLVTFTVMNNTSITLNFLSLFSLILALGLLVDDAIVIVTAVTAYWRTKKFTPNQTGLLVLRDFFVPIWSTTITAVWAFLPLLIASGIIGEFIKSISIVVSTTLIASTAIAILITLPLMMVFLKPKFPNRVKILINLVLFALIIAAVIFLTLKSPLLPLNIAATIILIFVTFKLRRELTTALTIYLDKIISTKKVASKLKDYANSGIVDSQKFTVRYQRFLNRILASKNAQNKTLIAVIAFALFSYLLVPLGLVKNEFFPEVDSDTLFVNVELPAGTNLETAEKESINLLQKIRNTEGTKYTTAEIGKSVSTSDFFAGQGAFNDILLTVVLEKENSIEVAQKLRSDYQNYSKGKFSVVEQSGGPPAGSDLQIKYSGGDLNILDSLADKTVEFLQNRPSTTTVEKSIKSGTSKITFVPDGTKMAQNQVSQTLIATQLRTFVAGFTLDSNVKFNNDTYDITFRNNSEVQSPQALGTVSIPTQQGFLPLSALGQLRLEPNPTRITREDRQRTISVSAGLKTGYNVPQENKTLEEFAASLNLPEGYSWQTGGVNEENQQSLNSVFQAMVIAFILIATTMVVQFGSYRKAFIVLLKIPLAISGVFLVFAISATPLSFPTVVGILALFGITVYQSMLIVDKIGKNTKAGMRLKYAITDGASSRFEPIMFGTITTVIGLIPITLSDPLWRGLGGAIIAGLLFSGAIMLLFIPVVYYKIFEKEIK